MRGLGFLSIAYAGINSNETFSLVEFYDTRCYNLFFPIKAGEIEIMGDGMTITFAITSVAHNKITMSIARVSRH